MFREEENRARASGEVMGGMTRANDESALRQSEWLTAKEAAAYLKVKTRSLLRWARLGNVRAYTLSGTRRHVWRFRKADLDAALLAKPVVSCESLPVRSTKGANN
jgi:excisionase family DNA binding protein